MTGTLEETKVDAQLTMRFFFDEDQRYQLSSLAQAIEGLQTLLIVGHYIYVNAHDLGPQFDTVTIHHEGQRQSARIRIAVRNVVSTRNVVTKCSLASPLDITVVLAGISTTLYAARGVIHIFEKWNRARVTFAKSNYQVEAYKLATDELRGIQQQMMPARGERLLFTGTDEGPTSDEIDVVSRVLPQLDRVELREPRGMDIDMHPEAN